MHVFVGKLNKSQDTNASKLTVKTFVKFVRTIVRARWWKFNAKLIDSKNIYLLTKFYTVKWLINTNKIISDKVIVTI